jgi:hypothetical protein
MKTSVQQDQDRDYADMWRQFKPGAVQSRRIDVSLFAISTSLPRKRSGRRCSTA